MIPIARKIIQKKKLKDESSSITNSKEIKIMTLDEQIALLEQNLEAGESSDEFEDEVGSDEAIYYGNEQDSIDVIKSKTNITTANDIIITEKDEQGKVLKIVSKINLERIKPLAKNYLPLPLLSVNSKKKRQMGLDGADVTEYKKMKKSKKRKTNAEIDNNSNGAIQNSEQGNNTTTSSSSAGMSGLESTIREMLLQYQPLSGEKRPFYCRICRYQAQNLADFEAHRLTSEHLLTQEIELKMSYCKLCKKQHTSPAQLKEHLQSKPHKNQLLYMKEKQFKSKQSNSRPASDNRQFS